MMAPTTRRQRDIGSCIIACLVMCLAAAVCRGQQPGQGANPSSGQSWVAPDGTVYRFSSIQSGVSPASGNVTIPKVQPGVPGLVPPANPRRTRALPITYPRPQDDDLLSGGDDLLSGGDSLLGGNDLLGGGGDDEDPLASMGPAKGGLDNIPGAGHGTDKPDRGGVPEGLDPHAEIYANNQYPSAMTCAKCHKKIYDEWRVSAHAYSAVSPMFQKFEQAITQLSSGTIGYFCMRCHAPVATQMEFDRSVSILDAPYVYREGVTCVACHRVKERYGRVHGERRIEPGPLQAPVYGSFGGDGVAKAIAEKDTYKVKTDPNSKKPGQDIHWEGIRFEQLSQSGFCQPCHQVAVHPGIALEVVWAQYRASPSCKKGISCQDCHMGLVPGKPNGYAYGAAAEMSGLSVNNHRKHANHLFFGPGNSIAHPGIFPHNEKALRWSVEQWMNFNWRAGWGTDEFEKAVAKKQIFVAFPPEWDSADERRDARKVLNSNFELLAVKKATSIEVMEAGSRVEGPFFKKAPVLGKDMRFQYKVSNVSEGHNNPSGSLGAQPQLWLNVVLTGPNGQWLWESGYLDGNGDLANQHSIQVRKGIIPPDKQLFNLQTQFLTTNVKGTDREMYLPVNVDIDQLPFLRPGAIPPSVMNHPPFIRMEQKSIPPLGHKMARYKVPGELLCQPGRYKLTVRMRSRMEPIYFMRFCNATPEMERRMLEQTIDLHPYTVEFTIR
ncbi:MAG: multiheme c-type cytochrome [Aureliella sp.]